MTPKIFAIADLHLPGGEPDKGMEVFGPHWQGHWNKIQADWRARVSPEDTVVIPGDISWAMTLPAALEDLQSIGALPGKKLLLRGNHDYWWNSIGRVRDTLPAGMYALQNDCIAIDGTVYCGTRGWVLPQRPDFGPHDQTIYAREVSRLRLSLQDAARKHKDVSPRVLMHFPPLVDSPTDFTALFAEFGVTKVVYGHLHGSPTPPPVQGTVDGVEYLCAACDQLRFRLAEW